MGKIIANVNEVRRDQLVSQVENVERVYPGFLDPKKDLVLIERKLEYLKKATQEVLRLLGLNEGSYHVSPPQYSDNQAYYNCNEEKRFMYTPINGSGTHQPQDLVLFLSRLKGRDSHTEKLTRYNAKHGTLENPNCPGRISVEDGNGFMVVSSSLEGCDALKTKIDQSQTMKPFGPMEDYFRVIMKNSGYNAIHQSYLWENGVPEMNQMIFELQYGILSSFAESKFGNPENPGLEHRRYRQDQLSKPHDQGNYQIIIIEGDEIVKPMLVEHQFAKYALIPGEDELLRESILPDGSSEESSGSYLLSI